MVYLESDIDGFRQEGRWDEVRKQYKQYVKSLKQKKQFNSAYSTEEERIAYSESLKADISISRRGKDRSAFKHIQRALDAYESFPDAIALATIIFLDRDRYPKNTNRLVDLRDSITANVKKNINKLKAQAQAMISTEDSPEEEGNDDEELSEEEDDDSEEYAIQKIGWKCISSFPIPYITEHILSLSIYQVTLYCIAMSLAYQAYEKEGMKKEANELLIALWNLLKQYNSNLQYYSELSVLSSVPSLNTQVVYTVIANLPVSLLSQTPISTVTGIYRIFLSSSGHYPSNPFPFPSYYMLIQQFVDLLVHVLAFSPCYSPFQLRTQEQIQIPSTALEEAIMLLQVLSNCFSQMSISQCHQIAQLAYDAFSEAELYKECVEFLEPMIQLLEHSSMIWYLIAMSHFRDNNFILCLQSLQNCLSDLKEYGQDEKNGNEIDENMVQLFAARVCLGHLNRIDDSIHFCASVLQSSNKHDQIVQAYQLTGSSIFLQARHSLVYSKRITLLNEAIRYFTEAISFSSSFNPILYYNLALAYAEKGEGKKAYEYIEELYKHNPFLPLLWPLRILLSYQLNDQSITEQLLQQAYDRSPTHLLIMYLDCQYKTIECSHDLQNAIILHLYNALSTAVLTSSSSAPLLIVVKSAVLCCDYYIQHNYLKESEKLISFLESLPGDMKEIKPYLLNEKAKLCFVQDNQKEGWSYVYQSKLYQPDCIDTMFLEASTLVSEASTTLSKISSLREDPEVTLDSILMKEHKATKQLLEAEQILQQILQRDQRLTSAWALWGYVLELLGQNEKAGEVILTSLEWNKINSFTDYSVCSILI